jgi:gluconolactonase
VTIELRDSRLEQILDPGAALEVVIDGADFGEGPVWLEPEGKLLFSDVASDVIRGWSADGGAVEHRRPSHKSNGLACDGAGRLLACEHASSRVTRAEHDGTVTTIASHWQQRELNSPNDIAVSRAGTIYFTDPPDGRISERWGCLRPRQIDFQGVYLIPPGGGEVALVADDFPFPNGLCLSPDERTLYVNDTQVGHVRAFDVRTDGTVEHDRVFLDQSDGDLVVGAPDGMACDEHGNLWATGPGGVWVAAPDGSVLGVIATPKFTSNLCFGGTDWSELYLTVTDAVYRLPTRTRGARLPHVVWGELQRLASDLRAELGTGRVTVRVDDVPGASFPVKAEACDAGVSPIAGDRLEGIRASDTFRWIHRERRVLVQDDIAGSPIAPAPALTERYGARAQLLAPVLTADAVRGIVSIHETSGIRSWSPAEIASAGDAADRVAAILGS